VNDPVHAPSVAVVGAGAIGVGWTIVFASAGCTVSVFELDPKRRDVAVAEVAGRLREMRALGLITAEVSEIVDRIHPTGRLEDAARPATYVQECVPEDLEVKRSTFEALDQLTAPEVVLASSTSAMALESFTEHLDHPARCVIAHPGNPPYLLRIVEVAAGPFTDPRAVEVTERLMEACGLDHIRVSHPVEGLVFNRLQGALLREAYCLVRDGVVSPLDLDRVVTEGLGRRWSVLGPFLTAHLNTQGGIRAHAQRLGPAYERMGAERGQRDSWTPALVDTVATDVERAYPLDQWADWVRWRDRRLMRLLAQLPNDSSPADEPRGG
jgi:L-gulonate 3-dehydrogenase